MPWIYFLLRQFEHTNMRTHTCPTPLNTQTCEHTRVPPLSTHKHANTHVSYPLSTHKHADTRVSHPSQHTTIQTHTCPIPLNTQTYGHTPVQPLSTHTRAPPLSTPKRKINDN